MLFFTMKLIIEPENRLPIYVQIEEQIRSLIAAGQLQPGDRLPPIRGLAADLRVNHNTIARVYLDLNRDGTISTQRGRGTFVAGALDEEGVARIRQEKLRAIVHLALKKAHALGYASDETAAVCEEELARWRETGGD